MLNLFEKISFTKREDGYELKLTSKKNFSLYHFDNWDYNHEMQYLRLFKKKALIGVVGISKKEMLKALSKEIVC